MTCCFAIRRAEFERRRRRSEILEGWREGVLGESWRRMEMKISEGGGDRIALRWKYKRKSKSLKLCYARGGRLETRGVEKNGNLRKKKLQEDLKILKL